MITIKITDFKKYQTFFFWKSSQLKKKDKPGTLSSVAASYLHPHHFLRCARIIFIIYHQDGNDYDEKDDGGIDNDINDEYHDGDGMVLVRFPRPSPKRSQAGNLSRMVLPIMT